MERRLETIHQRILPRTLLLAAGPREKEKKAQDLTLSLAPFPFLSSSPRDPSSCSRVLTKPVTSSRPNRCGRAHHGGGGGEEGDGAGGAAATTRAEG